MQNKKQNQTGSPGDLNHPGRELWMDYLYNESSRKEKAALDAHLEICAKCRADVQHWRAAMGMLDADKSFGEATRRSVPQPWLKWGIAAAIMLLAGFGVGRLTSTGRAEIEELRASVKSELRTELLAELQKEQSARLEQFKLDAEARQELDKKAIYNTIGTLETAHQTEYASLRKELETVALLTQAGFQQAQQQIVTLASSQGENTQKP